MSYRAPEETLLWRRLTTFATIATGAWLSYRHYAAAVERMQRRDEIPFGELRVIQEGKDPKLEIIAVQGLGSHPDRTWKSKEKNDEAADDMEKYPDLLKDLLPAYFKHSRITQWAYNSDWDHDGSVASLPDFGQDFLRQLNTHLECYKEKGMMLPVIFLGHSFGGLVIKEAFVAASDDNSIWRATRGIIFLGTPHMGSSLWRFAAVHALFNKLLGSNVDLSGAISLHNDHLKRLKDKFNDRLANGLPKAIGIVSISEAKPVYLFGFFSLNLVVESHSSEEHAHQKIKWTCGHTDLNKFQSIKDPRFRELVKQIDFLTPSYILKTADEKIRNVCYADEKLKIHRISGHRLDLKNCYINLGLVQVLSEGHKDSESMVAQSSNHTLMSRLRLEEPESKKRKKLSNLFNPITIDNIKKNVSRVLIYGRAGIGKSTLCKKIVDEFRKKKIWQKKFDRLLWIPLREIKGLQAGNDALKTVLEHRFFNDYDPDNMLAEKMSQQLRLEKFRRTVFLLDGLDEAISEFGAPGSRTILQMLVNMPNVIVTSRPHFNLPDGINSFDIETEVLGFTLRQVDRYIGKSGCDSLDDIRKFLRANKLVHDLVRIPIQLDALCYTWDGLYQRKPPRNMTELYEALQMKLAQKDLERDNPRFENNTLGRTENDIREDSESSTKLLMALAFSGMCLNEVNFDGRLRDMAMNSFGPEYRVRGTTAILQGLSFLRSTTSSSPKDTNHTTYHFLHLTYQEYFAAQYFVRQWQENRSLVILSNNGPGSFSKAEVNIEEFLVKNKYLPTLDVFWRFVCGLLPEHQQVHFFRLVGQNPDILGPTHQRLIMHCLAEANLALPVRDQLESELTNWVHFELSHLDKDSDLADEAEFPESVIDRILSNRSFKLRSSFLSRLLKRSSLPSLALTEIFIRAVTENEDSNIQGKEEWDIQHLGKSLLAAFNLPKDLADQILKRTEDKNTKIALDYLELLMSQQKSPVPPETIERYAQSPDPTVSSTLVNILRDCKYIPEVYFQYLPSWRQADNQNLRLAAIAIYDHPTAPDQKILEDILMLREDDEIEVRSALGNIFISQEAPTPKMMENAVRTLLKLEAQAETRGRRSPIYYQEHLEMNLYCHHRGVPRSICATLLRSRPRDEQLRLLNNLELFDSLSTDVTAEVVRLMQDKDINISRAAFWTLTTKKSLDQETLAAMIQNLESLFEQTRFHFMARQMLSTKFILSLRPLVQDTSHPLHHQAIQILKGEKRIVDGTLERMIPAFDNFHTIDRDLLELCHRLKYLTKELEQSLVSLLGHPDESIQSESGIILGNQSSLRLKSIEIIGIHLRGQSETTRLAAIEAIKGLKLLPYHICDIFCDLLQQHEETRLLICEVWKRDEDNLHENLSKALAELFDDRDPVIRETIFYLFKGRQKSAVPLSTIKYIIWKFRQCHGEENKSLRISMADAMGAHIADTELAPTFIQIVSMDISEVQIAFLESLTQVQSISNHVGEALLPLFDPLFDIHNHNIRRRVELNERSNLQQRVDVQRLLLGSMWCAGEKTTTPKIVLKMIQLLCYDDPRIKVAAGKILARHESDEYLHIFASLLSDSDSKVNQMAYDVLTDQSRGFKLSVECLDVLRGLLSDDSIRLELKEDVFNILKLNDFDHQTKSAQYLLVVILSFLKDEAFCEDAISILTKFDDLKGQNLGYMMLEVPFVYLSSEVFRLFLSQCSTEEFQTLLNDLDRTTLFYKTALFFSWDESISMHFINATDLQINTPTGAKIIAMQNPKTFLENIQKYRQDMYEESGIKLPLSIKNANLPGPCEGEKLDKGNLVNI